MDNIYLSIDIDYWINEDRSMKSFLRKALALKVPSTVVVSHEKLIPHINSSKAKTVINVDYHSDLADLQVKQSKIANELDEGTWGNFVKFKEDGTFIWIYPEKECWKNLHGERGHGRCDWEKSPFSRKSLEICGWRSVRRRKNRLLTKKEWDKVSRVGISMSTDWIDNYLAAESMKIIYDYDMLPENVYLDVTEQFIISGTPVDF